MNLKKSSAEADDLHGHGIYFFFKKKKKQPSIVIANPSFIGNFQQTACNIPEINI